MEINEVEQFPSLKNNEWVMGSVRRVGTAKISLTIAEEKMQMEIDDVQKHCTHIWKEERKRSESIASCSKSGGTIHHGLNVLESKTCTLCGLHQKRPDGLSFQICHSCWSKMEYHSTIPGQGERTMVYECTNPKCSNGSWHT